MELWVIVLRTIFTFFFLRLLLHLLGKREVGKLSLFDLVLAIMLAELAVSSLQNVSTPMISSLLPLLILFLLWSSFSYLFSKSRALRELRDIVKTSPPVFFGSLVLIKDGQLQHENIDKLGKNNFWLKAELKKRIGITNFKKISCCSIDDYGHWYIDLKDYLPQK